MEFKIGDIVVIKSGTYAGQKGVVVGESNLWNVIYIELASDKNVEFL